MGANGELLLSETQILGSWKNCNIYLFLVNIKSWFFFFSQITKVKRKFFLQYAWCCISHVKFSLAASFFTCVKVAVGFFSKIVFINLTFQTRVGGACLKFLVSLLNGSIDRVTHLQCMEDARCANCFSVNLFTLPSQYEVDRPYRQWLVILRSTCKFYNDKY